MLKQHGGKPLSILSSSSAAKTTPRKDGKAGEPSKITVQSVATVGSKGENDEKKEGVLQKSSRPGKNQASYAQTWEEKKAITKARVAAKRLAQKGRRIRELAPFENQSASAILDNNENKIVKDAVDKHDVYLEKKAEDEAKENERKAAEQEEKMFELLRPVKKTERNYGYNIDNYANRTLLLETKQKYLAYKMVKEVKILTSDIDKSLTIELDGKDNTFRWLDLFTHVYVSDYDILEKIEVDLFPVLVNNTEAILCFVKNSPDTIVMQMLLTKVAELMNEMIITSEDRLLHLMYVPLVCFIKYKLTIKPLFSNYVTIEDKNDTKIIPMIREDGTNDLTCIEGSNFDDDGFFNMCKKRFRRYLYGYDSSENNINLPYKESIRTNVQYARWKIKSLLDSANNLNCTAENWLDLTTTSLKRSLFSNLYGVNYSLRAATFILPAVYLASKYYEYQYRKSSILRNNTLCVYPMERNKFSILLTNKLMHALNGNINISLVWFMLVMLLLPVLAQNPSDDVKLYIHHLVAVSRIMQRNRYYGIIALYDSVYSNIRKNWLTNRQRNKLQHALNGNTNMILPAPKSLKEGSKLRDLSKPVKKYEPQMHRAGFDSVEYTPINFENSKENQLCALQARILAETPIPDPEYMGKYRNFILKNYNDVIGVTGVKSKTFQEYLLGSNAKPSVKEVLQRTYDKLVSMGINEYTKLSKRQLKKWTIRAGFVKGEANPYSSPLGIKQKAPRLIQGASPEFICLVGPFIAAAQIRLKQKWSKDKPIMFTSSYSSIDVADHVTNVDKDWEILEDDVSAWDASVSEELCWVEIAIVKRMGAPRAVVDLMIANIHTRGYTKDYYYEVMGIRKSGDPYTSLFNSILNGTIHLFIYCDSREVCCKQGLQELKMAVQGDDNLLRHKVGTFIKWKQCMNMMGFKAIALYRKVLTDAEFCSCYYVSTEKGNNFVPKTGKLLAKLCYFVNPPPNIPLGCLVKGVAYAFMLMHSDLTPVLRICEKLFQLTEHFDAVKPPVYEWQMNFKSLGNLSDHYFKKYYLTGDIMEVMTRQLENLKLGDPLPESYRFLLLDKDTGGPNLIYNTKVDAPSRRSTKDRVDKERDKSRGKVKINKKHKQSSFNLTQTAGVTSGTGIKKRRDNSPKSYITKQQHKNAVTATEHKSRPTIQKKRMKQGTSGQVCGNYLAAAVKGLATEVIDTPRPTTPNNTPVLIRQAGVVGHEGPTNQEMHATNGNVKTIRKAVKKEKKILRKEIKKVERKVKKPGLARRGMRTAGGFLGGLVGQSKLGSDAGDWFADILGMGDYRVRTNSIARSPNEVPIFSGMKDQGLIIEHTELVMDTKTSIDFKNISFNINPGNKNLFPWLSFHAAGYEQYEFLGLVFIFKTTSANALNSINAALGTHVISTEYDVSKPNFVSKQEMESYMFTVSTEPSKSVIHPVECNPKLDIVNSRYVSAGIIGSQSGEGIEKNLIDLGILQFASVGSQSAYVSGELHVSYKVKFTKPRAPPAGSLTYMAHWSNRAAATGSASGSSPLQNMSILIGQSTIPSGGSVTLSTVGNDGYISFNQVAPNRTFMINLWYFDGGGNITTGNFIAFTGLKQTPYWMPYPLNGSSSIGSSAAGNYGAASTCVTTSDQSFAGVESVKIGFSNTTAGTYYTDLTVIEIPYTSAVYGTSSMSEQLKVLQDKLQSLTMYVEEEDGIEHKEMEKPLDESLYLPRSVVAKMLGR